MVEVRSPMPLVSRHCAVSRMSVFENCPHVSRKPYASGFTAAVAAGAAGTARTGLGSALTRTPAAVASRRVKDGAERYMVARRWWLDISIVVGPNWVWLRCIGEY